MQRRLEEELLAAHGRIQNLEARTGAAKEMLFYFNMFLNYLVDCSLCTVIYLRTLNMASLLFVFVCTYPVDPCMLVFCHREIDPPARFSRPSLVASKR